MQAVIIVSFVLMAFFAITTAFKAWQQNDAVVSCEDYSDTELVTVTGGDWNNLATLIAIKGKFLRGASASHYYDQLYFV